MLLAKAVEKDARNQKTGERKEKVHSDPAPFSGRLSFDAVMEAEHRRNGHATQAIERCEALFIRRQ